MDFDPRGIPHSSYVKCMIPHLKCFLVGFHYNDVLYDYCIYVYACYALELALLLGNGIFQSAVWYHFLGRQLLRSGHWSRQ